MLGATSSSGRSHPQERGHRHSSDYLERGDSLPPVELVFGVSCAVVRYLDLDSFIENS